MLAFAFLTLVCFSPTAEGSKGGKCTQGDCVNGFGTFKYKDKSVYEGDFKNGLREGAGTLRSRDWEMMAAWRQDELEGDVVIEFIRGKHKGRIYSGGYQLGSGYNGFGLLSMKNGESIEGFFRSGKLMGQAIHRAKNGRIIRQGLYLHGRFIRNEIVQFSEKDRDGASTEDGSIVSTTGLTMLRACRGELKNWELEPVAVDPTQKRRIDEAYERKLSQLREINSSIKELAKQIDPKALQSERRLAVTSSGSSIASMSKALNKKQEEQSKRIIEIEKTLLPLRKEKRRLQNEIDGLVSRSQERNLQKGPKQSTTCKTFLENSRDQIPKSCIPRSIEEEQLAMILVKELEEIPEQLHLESEQLFNSAMQKIFPCGN